MQGLSRQLRNLTINCARNYSTKATVNGIPIEIYNQGAEHRVVVTKTLPGTKWLDILTNNNCQVDVCLSEQTILDIPTITKLIGQKCHGVIGQLTEDWKDELFGALKGAGGTAYSNYAVGYNNVHVPSATKHGIAVGNTPGVLTEPTAELAVALTFAAARRVVEADNFQRAGLYKGWLPDLFIGNLLQGKTVGIIGAGRIGTAYARMMSEGHKMNIVYYDPYQNKALEAYIKDYSANLQKHGEAGITITQLPTIEDVLKQADVVSLHCNLDETTRHVINESRLNMMKPNAMIVNAARGPCIDEAALVKHLKKHPEFKAALDVFEFEPAMVDGLTECNNAVIVPHIASASMWTRSGMATLAAANVAMRLNGHPAHNKPDVLMYVDGEVKDMPSKSPSIVNAADLGIQVA